MGVSKTYLFTTRCNRLATIARAMGHPARIAILDLIYRLHGTKGTTILDNIPLSQPTLSQHIYTLQKAKLITSYVVRNEYHYQLSRFGFKVLSAYCRSLGDTIDDSG